MLEFVVVIIQAKARKNYLISLKPNIA